ncbi:hypothetical protein N6B72_12100 [Chryseobacterium soli]|uniref:hypothetical protein n=1 Tax=Chryseobacterium soli TaxID=445961 RepID=UPI00295459EB|nr:hypothetical protein [Chryseobacterium soli]MDV7697663.1 hypothetical protein [Chryseobacterium soli]
MKKIIIVFILIFAFAYFFLKDARILKLEESYAIVNEIDRKIPATLYYRNVDVEVGGKMENVYEILIFFDKEVEIKFNPIVVVPKYKLIGVAEGGERGFIKFGDDVLQLSKDSNNFTTLDNTVFFDNPPIKEIKIEENSITFNSFESLIKYGKYIILKKQ